MNGELTPNEPLQQTIGAGFLESGWLVPLAAERHC